MTITANYAYLDPEIAEYFEEAFERAGVDPAAIGQSHIDSALRSVKFLLSEWNTYGQREWMVTQYQKMLTAGSSTFDMPVGAVSIVGAVLSRNSRVTPMYAMSRDEYREIPDKTVQGRPSRYFADKQYSKVSITFWQTAQNSTDIMILDYIQTIARPGEMYNTLQLPPVAYEAFVAGLAMKLAQKFNGERYNMLRVDYGGERYPEKLGGKLFLMLKSTGADADISITFARGRR